MSRRAIVRRTPRKARPITDSVKRRINDLAAHTDMPQREIAAEVGVDGGRVSEILHGDR
jgi:predicted XRE-type DNA-binding protein